MMNQQNQQKQNTNNTFIELGMTIFLLIVSFTLASILLNIINQIYPLITEIKYILSIVFFFGIFFGLQLLTPRIVFFINNMMRKNEK